MRFAFSVLAEMQTQQKPDRKKTYSYFWWPAEEVEYQYIRSVLVRREKTCTAVTPFNLHFSSSSPQSCTLLCRKTQTMQAYNKPADRGVIA